MGVDFIQHRAAQVALFESVSEAQNSGLVWSLGHAQVYADEAAQRGRFIERIFPARIEQIEPLLHEISPERDLKSYRTATVAAFG